jgi:hypothetical protein
MASPASWNPAVPPPPVTGAELGNGEPDELGDGLRVALGEALELALTDVLGVAVVVLVVTSFGEMETLAETDTLTEALTLAPALAVAVALGPALALAPALGENTLAVDVEVPDVQAETATQAKMASRPPPTALRRARCAIHALAVRALIGPPHAPAKTTISRPGATETGTGGKPRGRPLRAWPANQLPRRKLTSITVSQNGRRGRQWRAWNGEY